MRRLAARFFAVLGGALSQRFFWKSYLGITEKTLFLWCPSRPRRLAGKLKKRENHL
jgi:hypothetical protein